MFSCKLTSDAELRPVEMRYCEELYAVAAANVSRLGPWFGWATPEMRVEDTRQFLSEAMAESSRGTTFLALLFVGGKLAGTVDLHNISARNKTAEIGYWLAGEYEGRGLMRAAVAALLDHGFGMLKLHRIDILAEPENARSRAVAERLGFEFEGVRREVAWIRERCGDLACYRMMGRDWAKAGSAR